MIACTGKSSFSLPLNMEAVGHGYVWRDKVAGMDEVENIFLYIRDGSHTRADLKNSIRKNADICKDT